MKQIYILLPLLFTMSFASAQIEGSWKMSPQAAALAVGPSLDDLSWWSNSIDDVEGRACFFDDKFVFSEDGTFTNEMQESTWLEGWQGVAQDECGAPVAPHDGSAAATWAYDETAGTVTITGTGAHLGLPKVINGAEIDNPANAAASIVYNAALSADGETMTVNVNFGPGVWQYVLVRTNTTSVKDRQANIFEFFPNPATSTVQIKADENIDQLVIRDMAGRVVLTQSNLSSNETINVANLPKGLFLLECRSSELVTVKKLMLK